MRILITAFLLFGVAFLAGCGESIHWFPGNSGSSSGTIPSPPPPGGTLTDLQADTVIKFDPYTVAFGNITTSTTTTSVTVSGDASSQYSINGGTPTSSSGTVKKGDVVSVQNTSSNFGQNISVSTILNIGGASATYTGSTGKLIFLTRKGATVNTPNYASDQMSIPLVLPGSFTFPATIKLDTTKTTSGSSSSMWVNGNIQADGFTVIPGMFLQLKHTTAATSGTTVTTAVTLTPQTGPGTPYTVTYKSVTQ
jgi:hypothetical protein